MERRISYNTTSIHGNYGFEIELIGNKISLNYFDLDSLFNKTYVSRIPIRKATFDILKEWGKIYMTNWALNSPLNYDKYKTSLIEIPWWENKWWSLDYNITIWENDRYYHCFSIAELEYLASVSWFKIIENRLFENQRNIITILQK